MSGGRKKKSPRRRQGIELKRFFAGDRACHTEKIRLSAGAVSMFSEKNIKPSTVGKDEDGNREGMMWEQGCVKKNAPVEKKSQRGDR